MDGPFDDVYNKALAFISRCYGMAPHASMNNLRYNCWLKQIGSAKTLCPPLHSLPPTDASFAEHLKRAMYQFIVWKHADQPNAPLVNPSDWGWSDEEGYMMPVMVPI